MRILTVKKEREKEKPEGRACALASFIRSSAFAVASYRVTPFLRRAARACVIVCVVLCAAFRSKTFKVNAHAPTMIFVFMEKTIRLRFAASTRGFSDWWFRRANARGCTPLSVVAGRHINMYSIGEHACARVCACVCMCMLRAHVLAQTNQILCTRRECVRFALLATALVCVVCGFFMFLFNLMMRIKTCTQHKATRRRRIVPFACSKDSSSSRSCSSSDRSNANDEASSSQTRDKNYMYAFCSRSIATYGVLVLYVCCDYEMRTTAQWRRTDPTDNKTGAQRGSLRHASQHA